MTDCPINQAICANLLALHKMFVEFSYNLQDEALLISQEDRHTSLKISEILRATVEGATNIHKAIHSLEEFRICLRRISD